MTPFKITTNKIAREKYIEFSTLLHIFRTGFEACKKPRDRSKLSLFDLLLLYVCIYIQVCVKKKTM
jgi:hypothetical protein